MTDEERGNHQTQANLTRGALAAATACNPETIRYYEKMGLLPAPPRTAAGYRVYGRDHVVRLRFILRARELGFTMGDIRGLLGLDDGGAPNCAEVKHRTECHLADIRAGIADLERIASVLSDTAARCSGDEVPRCPALEAIGAGRPCARPGRTGGGD